MQLASGFSCFEEFAPGSCVKNDKLPVAFGEIFERTGITSRHFASADETEVSIGIEVGQKIFHTLNIKGKDCGGLVFASCTMGEESPEQLMHAAREVAKVLNIEGPAIGVNYACSGFPAAVQHGLSIRETTDRHVPVITAEIMSRIVNWKNEATAVLFGDNAAATTIANGGHEILHASAWHIEDDKELIHLEKTPDAMDERGVVRERVCIKMNGKPLYVMAPGEMVALTEQCMQKLELEKADVSALIPHQANGRFMEKIRKILQKKYGTAFDHMWIVDEIAPMGNVASSSIPSALARVQDCLLPGTAVICPAIGAGPGFARGQLTEGVLAFRVAGEQL